MFFYYIILFYNKNSRSVCERAERDSQFESLNMFEFYVTTIMGVLGVSLALPVWFENALILIEKDRQVSMSFTLLLFTAFILLGLGICSLLIQAMFLAASYFVSSAAWLTMAFLKHRRNSINSIPIDEVNNNNLV